MFRRTHLRGSKQKTDTCLLDLVVNEAATFVTLDHRLDPKTVRTGEGHLLVIG